MEFKLKNRSFNIFISKIHVTVNVSSESWKCFRCNLTFNEEDHAKLHQEIANHSVRTVKSLEV